MPVLGKSKREVLMEFRTSEILQAARTVFATHGYAAATVDEIAETAGIAKGTVYLYFSSKQDLFLAALREGVIQLHADALREIESAQTARDKIRAFIHARLAYCDQNRDFFRIYYTEFSSMLVRSSRAQPEFQDLYDEQAALLASLLHCGVETGEVRPIDTTKTALLIYELTRAAIAQRMLGWPEDAPEETTNLLCDLIWRGIGC